MQLAVAQPIGAHGLLRSGANLNCRAKPSAIINVLQSTDEFYSAATDDDSLQRANT